MITNNSNTYLLWYSMRRWNFNWDMRVSESGISSSQRSLTNGEDEVDKKKPTASRFVVVRILNLLLVESSPFTTM